MAHLEPLRLDHLAAALGDQRGTLGERIYFAAWMLADFAPELPCRWTALELAGQAPRRLGRWTGEDGGLRAGEAIVRCAAMWLGCPRERVRRLFEGAGS